MLAHAGGFRLNHVHYSGEGPAITAVLGGHVAATANTAAVAKDPEMLRHFEAAGLELDHRDGKAFQDLLDAVFKPVEAAVNRIWRVE
jgi:hypothetical protein